MSARAELEAKIAAQHTYIGTLDAAIPAKEAEIAARQAELTALHEERGSAVAWLADLEAQLAALPPDGEIENVRVSIDANGHRIDFDTTAPVASYGHASWTSKPQPADRRTFDLTRLPAETDIPVKVTWADGRVEEFTVRTGADAPVPLPYVWDASAVAHGFLDCWGLRPRVDVATWEARTGLRARVIGTFANARPFTQGDWGDVPAAVVAGEARWLVQCTQQAPDTRGKTPTEADIKADIAKQAGWLSGPETQSRRAATAMRAFGPAILDRVMVRTRNERPSNWFSPFGYFLNITANIPAAKAESLGAQLADQSRRIDEREMRIWADVLGEDYGRVTWVINAAGTLGNPRAEALFARAWPRDVPPGTKLVLTTDSYVSERGDANRLASNLAAVDRLALSLPGVLAVGIDEIGPHNGLDDSATKLDGLAEEKREFVRIWVEWARRHADGTHPVPLSHSALYETCYPNGRTDSTVLFADRRQPNPKTGVVGTLVLRGRENATFTAANGEVVPSNDPEMAAEFLRLVRA